VARGAAIRFLGSEWTGVSDVADKAECWRAGKWVHDSGGNIGDDKHIALVNSLETPDTGAIKGDAFDKRLCTQLTNRDTEMLPGTRQVYKLEVYHLRAILLSELQDFFRGHIFLLLL